MNIVDKLTKTKMAVGAPMLDISGITNYEYQSLMAVIFIPHLFD